MVKETLEKELLLANYLRCLCQPSQRWWPLFGKLALDVESRYEVVIVEVEETASNIVEDCTFSNISTELVSPCTVGNSVELIVGFRLVSVIGLRAKGIVQVAEVARDEKI